MMEISPAVTAFDNAERLKPLYNKLSTVIGLVVFVIGFLGVLAYGLNIPEFIELRTIFQPSYGLYSPLSLCILGIGIVVILDTQPYHEKSKWLWPVRVITILVPAVIGLYFIGIYLVQAEYHPLLPLVRGYQGVSVSFFSACAMFLSALCFWIFLKYKSSEAAVIYGIGIPALFLFYLSLFIAAGYFLEVPTLLSYKMSLPSAIGYTLISLSLLLSTIPYQGILLPLLSPSRRAKLMAYLTIIAVWGILIYGAISISLLQIENAKAVGIDISLLIASSELAIITVAILAKAIGLRAVHYYSETLRFAGKQAQIADIAEYKSRLLRLVMDNATSSMFLSDENGRCTFANKTVETMLGYTSEELQGQVLHDVVHRGHPNCGHYPIEECPIAQAVLFKRQKYESKEEFLTRKDGSLVPVSFMAIPYTDVDKGVIVEATDITELKRNQRIIEAYTKKLEQSNKDLEYFATLASHDLKAPLRKARFFYSQILNSIQDKADTDTIDLIQRVDQSLASMQNLITDLLALASINKSDASFQKVELLSVIHRVLSNLEEIIQEKKADIEIGTMTTLWGDESQLEQLFQNLIENALKYQPGNQIPHIKIWTTSIEGQRCQVMVEDNGIGFNLQFADKIFEPFERLHGKSSDYPGTGVGLAICKRIVERHGGTIHAHSEQGKGSLFTVHLSCEAQPNEL